MGTRAGRAVVFGGACFAAFAVTGADLVGAALISAVVALIALSIRRRT